MKVKSGIEKNILKLLHAHFFKLDKYAQNCKFCNKNDLLCAWWDFNKKFACKYVHTYNKLNFKPQISPRFYFEQVNEG